MTRLARQTPPGARPSREQFTAVNAGRSGPPRLPGRLLEVSGNRHPRGMVIAPARPAVRGTKPRVNRMAAGCGYYGRDGRKVRAPQDRVVGNADRP